MKWYEHETTVVVGTMIGAGAFLVVMSIIVVTQFSHQPEPTPTDFQEVANPKDFRDFADPRQYCPVAKPGSVTLGYGKPNQWTDQVLCLSAEGIWEVSATSADALTERLVPAQSAQGIYWTRSAMSDQKVVLSDELAAICPGENKPVAVLPWEIDTYQTGATIRKGTFLCMVDGDLVRYETSLASTSGNPPRWPNFTPTL